MPYPEAVALPERHPEGERSPVHAGQRQHLVLDRPGHLDSRSAKTVSAGAVSATATATPVTLGFTPGDGGHTVTCQGPGTEFKATVDTWVSPENPQGCSYRYPHSSYGVGGDDQVTATYTITWKVDMVRLGRQRRHLQRTAVRHHLPVLGGRAADRRHPVTDRCATSRLTFRSSSS